VRRVQTPEGTQKRVPDEDLISFRGFEEFDLCVIATERFPL
jgi:hypothetical protein